MEYGVEVEVEVKRGIRKLLASPSQGVTMAGTLVEMIMKDEEGRYQ